MSANLLKFQHVARNTNFIHTQKNHAVYAHTLSCSFGGFGGPLAPHGDLRYLNVGMISRVISRIPKRYHMYSLTFKTSINKPKISSLFHTLTLYG